MNIYFIKGVLIGISMAAPLGPLALLTIKRSLTNGHLSGLATALGVSIADGIYALLAALGLSAISSVLITQEKYLDLLGGIVLVLIGWKAYTSKPPTQITTLKSSGLVMTFLQTLLLTLANPLTIATFMAAFTAVGFEGEQHEHALAICFGVTCGSALWFIALSIVTAQLRTKVTPTVLLAIQKISGIVIAGFGILLLFLAVRLMIIGLS